jgi:hypothetical protein
VRNASSSRKKVGVPNSAANFEAGIPESVSSPSIKDMFFDHIEATD